MWAIFVSLLLSITIGNSLHTMEINVDEGKDSKISMKESSNISQTKKTLESYRSIKSLADMTKLATQLVDSQRKRCNSRNNSLQKSKIETSGSTTIEIPDSITIDPQVFVEYANSENIMEEFESGSFERILCCKSSRKNRFEYVHKKTPERYKDWAKEMILLFYYEQNNQMEVTTREQPQNFENTYENNNNNENEQKIKILEEQLRQETWKNKRLVKKTELNQKLRSFIEKQQAHEDNTNKWKKFGLLILLEAACFIGGMYSVC